MSGRSSERKSPSGGTFSRFATPMRVGAASWEGPRSRCPTDPVRSGRGECSCRFGTRTLPYRFRPKSGRQGVSTPYRALGIPGRFQENGRRLCFASRPVFGGGGPGRVPARGGGEGDGRVLGVFRRARARTERWLAVHAGDSDGALFLRALTTGESPPPSHPMVSLLQRTGLAHLLAISGGNVAIFYLVT